MMGLVARLDSAKNTESKVSATGIAMGDGTYEMRAIRFADGTAYSIELHR